MSGPFDLGDPAAYAAWRSRRLAQHPRTLAELTVEVGDPRALTAAERSAIVERCARANMAIYAGRTGSDPDKEIPRRLGRQLGLLTLDGNYLADDGRISPIAVAEEGTRTAFIPYTTRPIKWLVCNNILHDRQAFADSAQRKRLIYRARYYERVSGS